MCNRSCWILGGPKTKAFHFYLEVLAEQEQVYVKPFLQQEEGMVLKTLISNIPRVFLSSFPSTELITPASLSEKKIDQLVALLEGENSDNDTANLPGPVKLLDHNLNFEF